MKGTRQMGGEASWAMQTADVVMPIDGKDVDWVGVASLVMLVLISERLGRTPKGARRRIGGDVWF